MRLARYDKLKHRPFSEPYREWDLEICDYCEKSLPLSDDRCGHCGTWRRDQDRNLRDRLVVWKTSPEGQQAYHDHEQALARDRSSRATMGALYVAWGALIVFGFVGWIWRGSFDLGLIAAAVAFVVSRWLAPK